MVIDGWWRISMESYPMPASLTAEDLYPAGAHRRY